MVDFKQLTTYEYKKELDTHIVLHPLFYTAYHYAYKALLTEYPESDLFEPIELEKPIFSYDANLSSRLVVDGEVLLDKERDSWRGVMQQIIPTQFLLAVMEVFPRFYRLDFYLHMNEVAEESIIPMETPFQTGGHLAHLSNPVEDYSLPDDEGVFEKSHRKWVDVSRVHQSVDYSYIYLALGGLLSESMTDWIPESPEDYLDKLHVITVVFVDQIHEEIQTTRRMYSDVLSKESNEVRLAFYDFLKGRSEDLEGYTSEVNKRNNDSSNARFRFSYLGTPSYRGTSYSTYHSEPPFSEEESDTTNRLEDIILGPFEEIGAKEDFVDRQKRAGLPRYDDVRRAANTMNQAVSRWLAVNKKAEENSEKN